MYLSPKLISHVVLLCTLAFITCPARAVIVEWRPVDPADLALKAPRVDKEAGAEAIFWEVWVMDELQGSDTHTVLTHYVRLKIFNDRGREAYSTIDIPTVGKVQIRDVAGRTIKPDGTILELKKDAVFERTLVKAGGLKINAKSFAMPGVEPGAIIEYRYREYRDNQLSQYMRLPFQRDIPIQKVTYHIKPLNVPWLPWGMRTMSLHCNPTPFTRDRDGYFTTSLNDAPAIVEEPHMPPHDEVQGWMLIYYAPDKKLTPENYWKDYGRETYKAYKDSMKVGGDVRKIANGILNGAANDDEKLRRIYQYCQTKIKNVQHDVITAEERADTKQNKRPADTLSQEVGTGFDIDMAFAALASAAGFDARMTRLADRGDHFFNAAIVDSYFMRGFNVAVRVDDKWRFFDPASTYIPYGMLRWQEEGQKTLVSDNKEPEFVDTPMTGPEKSVAKRSGVFHLDEEGTLEGDVKLMYTGHQAVGRRNSIESDSAEQRLENIREEAKSRMSTAEVTDVKVENAGDAEKPLTYSFHIKVPGYAQRTGKRLFLQPSFFEFNTAPMFPNATRKYPVYFHYAWSEEDSVQVKLPDGYEFDHPDIPGGFNLGGAGQYSAKAQITSDKRLLYTRQLTFGAKASLLFPAEVYPQLKKIFDAIHESDTHTLTLKQQAGATR